MPVSRRGGPHSVMWDRQVDDVAMMNSILLVSSVFPLLNSILPLLHTCLLPLHDGIFVAVQKFVTSSVFKFWASVLTLHLAGQRVRRWGSFFSLIWIHAGKSVHSPSITVCFLLIPRDVLTIFFSLFPRMKLWGQSVMLFWVNQLSFKSEMRTCLQILRNCTNKNMK
jgi:hypothetical protein